MHASFSNERAWKARRENARTGTISDDEDGGRGRGRGRDPVAAPQLALILVNPRLSNLHPFVLRSGRQAARLSPRFTTGIFRVSSQGTGTDGGGREEGAKPENDDSSRSFHVNFTRDCRSFRCRLRPEKERERGEEEWRRIDQLDGKYLRRVTSGVSAAWRSKSRGKTLTTWVRREKKREGR